MLFYLSHRPPIPKLNQRPASHLANTPPQTRKITSLYIYIVVVLGMHAPIPPPHQSACKPAQVSQRKETQQGEDSTHKSYNKNRSREITTTQTQPRLSSEHLAPTAVPTSGPHLSGTRLGRYTPDGRQGWLSSARTVNEDLSISTQTCRWIQTHTHTS